MQKQCLLACLLFTILIAVASPAIQAQAVQQKPVAVAALPSQFAGKSAGADAILLTWKRADETNILSFEVQRSADSISFTPILLMHAKGAIKKPNGYTYTDANLQPGCYFYRLRTETFDGKETYSPVVLVGLQNSNTLQMQTARL